MNWINNNIQKAKENSGKRNILLQFLFIIAFVAIAVISLKLYKKSIHLNEALVYYGIVLLLGFVLYLKTLLLKPLLFVWLLLGLILGEITSTIILGFVYYFLFTPITIVIRSSKRSKQSLGKWKDRKDIQIDYKRLF